MANGRIYYLDALRSFCMLYGIFVHAATTVSVAPYGWIGEISSLFRLSTFFLISGFFAALLMERRGLRAFVNARLIALGVPLVVCLALLNPETNYLIYVYHNGWTSIDAFVSEGWGAGAEGPMVWHLHLWFLFSLIVYVLLTPFLVSAIRSLRLPEVYGQIDARLGWAAFPLLAVVSSLLVVAMRTVYFILLKPVLGGTPVDWLVLITFNYFPYFAIGLLAYHASALFQRLHTVSLLTLAVAVGMLVLVGQRDVQAGDLATKTFFYFAKGVATFGFVGALMALFRRWITGPSAALSLISGSVYSVYLLHFIAIYILAVALQPVIANPHVLFAIICALTFAITLGLHEFVISRSRTLLFLLNGRPRSSVPATAKA